MSSVKLKLPIKFRFEISNEELHKYLKYHKRLQPAKFIIGTNYAVALEYGTGPLKDHQKYVDDGIYTYASIYHAIDEWARKKYNMQSTHYRHKFVKKVVDRMFDEGMRPHIYFRPAWFWLQENLQRMFDEGNSIKEILDDVLRQVNDRIMELKLPYTGTLQRSMTVLELNPDTLTEEPSVYRRKRRTELRELADRIWREEYEIKD